MASDGFLKYMTVDLRRSQERQNHITMEAYKDSCNITVVF